MSTNEPVSLTREEMIELRLNPDCPICSARLPDYPVDVRWKDARIVRTSTGLIREYFGWYSEQQARTRRLAGELFANAFTDKMKERGMWFEGAAQ